MEDTEKLSLINIEQKIMKLIRKHCVGNKKLEKDLFELLELVEETERKQDKIRELAFTLANKL